MELHILLLFASTVRLQDTFKGFRFEDNKSKYRWEDGKNGIPQLNHDSFLPPSMTVCMRGRMLYYRHGDYKYWFNVIINNRKPRIGSVPNDFALYQMPKRCSSKYEGGRFAALGQNTKVHVPKI